MTCRARSSPDNKFEHKLEDAVREAVEDTVSHIVRETVEAEGADIGILYAKHNFVFIRCSSLSEFFQANVTVLDNRLPRHPEYRNSSMYSLSSRKTRATTTWSGTHRTCHISIH